MASGRSCYTLEEVISLFDEENGQDIGETSEWSTLKRKLFHFLMKKTIKILVKRVSGSESDV